MEHIFSQGVSIEEVKSEALERYKDNLTTHEDGFVRFLPSRQVKTSKMGD